MADAMPVWVVIAAYNEARVIARVVGEVARRGYHVVVVDDGSADDTAERASAASVVVRHPINLGQGAALQTGIDFAVKRRARHIVTFDAVMRHEQPPRQTRLDREATIGQRRMRDLDEKGVGKLQQDVSQWPALLHGCPQPFCLDLVSMPRDLSIGLMG